MKQGDDWLEWRRGGLGASDIAAAYTRSYGGAFKVVATKLGLKASTISPGLAERGLRWERPVSDAVHALTGYYVHAEQLAVESPRFSRWRATLDGLLAYDERTTLAEAEAVLEVKTVGSYARPNWAYYLAQMQWQMLVAEKSRALLALATIGVDLDGNETVAKVALYWHERDDALIEQLTHTADRLLVAIDNKRLPEPDVGTDLADVKTVFATPAPPAEPVDLTGFESVVEDYRVAKAKAKEFADEARHLEAQIRHRIGDNTEGLTPGLVRVRVGQPVRRFTEQSAAAALLSYPDYGVMVLDRARFKEAMPGAYDDLKVDTTDRRITIKDMAE